MDADADFYSYTHSTSVAYDTLHHRASQYEGKEEG